MLKEYLNNLVSCVWINWTRFHAFFFLLDIFLCMHLSSYGCLKFAPTIYQAHSLIVACIFTPADVDLQRKLLDPSLASCELDEDTLQQLADTIGDKWASIAPLLSFNTTEIEQIRNEDCPAWAMLQKLKEKGILTHEQLCSHLQTISLLKSTI